MMTAVTTKGAAVWIIVVLLLALSRCAIPSAQATDSYGETTKVRDSAGDVENHLFGPCMLKSHNVRHLHTSCDGLREANIDSQTEARDDSQVSNAVC